MQIYKIKYVCLCCFATDEIVGKGKTLNTSISKHGERM